MEFEQEEGKSTCPECNSEINFKEKILENLQYDELLPKNIECPECKEELELEETERKSKQFTCPWCEKIIDLS